jgi:sugar phosphate isomerase/epimerase
VYKIREAQISVQLYSLRDHLADLDVTLAHLAEIGAEAIEPFWITDGPDELAEVFARHGLTAPTVQSPFLSDEIVFDGHAVTLPPAESVFDAAARLGARIVFDPMVAPDRWRTPDAIRRTADRLNQAAEIAAAFGLIVGYHNHSFEFHHSIDGVSGYEYFVSLLDPHVVLELDVFWAAVANQDVAALVNRLDGRVRALHLKDGFPGVDPFDSGESYVASTLDQCPLGDGAIDVAGILDATSSCEFDVIEFDHVDTDVFDAIAASIAFLQRSC